MSRGGPERTRQLELHTAARSCYQGQDRRLHRWVHTNPRAANENVGVFFVIVVVFLIQFESVNHTQKAEVETVEDWLPRHCCVVASSPLGTMKTIGFLCGFNSFSRSYCCTVAYFIYLFLHKITLSGFKLICVAGHTLEFHIILHLTSETVMTHPTGGCCFPLCVMEQMSCKVQSRSQRLFLVATHRGCRSFDVCLAGNSLYICGGMFENLREVLQLWEPTCSSLCLHIAVVTSVTLSDGKVAVSISLIDIPTPEQNYWHKKGQLFIKLYFLPVMLFEQCLLFIKSTGCRRISIETFLKLICV